MTSKAQKERMMTEFRSLTHAIPADASRICKKAGYRLEAAFELFYNDHLAQQNAERSMQSRSKALAEAFGSVLNLQFNEFQDPDEPAKMDMNGLMRYLEVLSLTPEDPKVLCLCHLLHSPRLGVVERADYLKYWTVVLVKAAPPSIKSAGDMTKFQIATLAELDRRLRSELSYFEEVYRYTFDFGRDEGQKSLALSTAIPLWELILPLAPGLDPKVFKPEYLQWWFELLRSRNKSVSRDTWNLFLDFVVQLEDRFENYDETAAWPSLIDDYVTLAREKLGSQVTELQMAPKLTKSIIINGGYDIWSFVRAHCIPAGNYFLFFNTIGSVILLIGYARDRSHTDTEAVASGVYVYAAGSSGACLLRGADPHPPPSSSPPSSSSGTQSQAPVNRQLKQQLPSLNQLQKTSSQHQQLIRNFIIINPSLKTFALKNCSSICYVDTVSRTMSDIRSRQHKAKQAAMGNPPIPPSQSKPKPPPAKLSTIADHQNLSQFLQNQLNTPSQQPATRSNTPLQLESQPVLPAGLPSRPGLPSQSPLPAGLPSRPGLPPQSPLSAGLPSRPGLPSQSPLPAGLPSRPGLPSQSPLPVDLPSRPDRPTQSPLPVGPPSRRASKYNNSTEKKMARGKRIFGPDFYIMTICPSPTKPVVLLPKHGSLSKMAVTSSAFSPHLFLELHSFNLQPPTPTFLRLSEIISDLFKIANLQPNIHSNKHQLGQMCLLGFQNACDVEKSGGLSPADLEEKNRLWDKLDGHNDFIANRIKSLSEAAYTQNAELMSGRQNWHQNQQQAIRSNYKIANNLSITWNDFFDNSSEDSHNLTGWKYGLFSYIHPQSGKPISPPSSTLGHGLFFPALPAIVDFVHSNGIVEVLWKASTESQPFTTMPPDQLKTSDSSTHLACYFQIKN
ncbi:hypothetical protein PtA15_11A77 [Puccinia triticina]|uniref:Defective in cullin neddylation protein n=1 Tax=Puccinia triticina TaxID=208348 RepID=A0ABY7D030_9BASI|nr:uncharacterized protein PtA15_11A77 [Puccinia triticina]WAQ89390.1 hypothetical protein PtA15_11A77 [Puccinia triticina]